MDEAFNKAKEMLMGDQLLVHFDPRKRIVLSVDASPYGLGAVLSHRMKGRVRKADCLCVTYVEWSRAGLRASRKRKSRHNIWCKKISTCTCMVNVLP